jgi:hypothetical protein
VNYNTAGDAAEAAEPDSAVHDSKEGESGGVGSIDAGIDTPVELTDDGAGKGAEAVMPQVPISSTDDSKACESGVPGDDVDGAANDDANCDGAEAKNDAVVDRAEATEPHLPCSSVPDLKGREIGKASAEADQAGAPNDDAAGGSTEAVESLVSSDSTHDLKESASDMCSDSPEDKSKLMDKEPSETSKATSEQESKDGSGEMSADEPKRSGNSEGENGFPDEMPTSSHIKTEETEDCQADRVSDSNHDKEDSEVSDDCLVFDWVKWKYDSEHASNSNEEFRDSPSVPHQTPAVIVERRSVETTTVNRMIIFFHLIGSNGEWIEILKLVPV